MVKQKFCMGSNAECAHYVVCKALGREKVPADLYPIQLDRAKALVK